MGDRATYAPLTNRQRGLAFALIALLYLGIFLVFFAARVEVVSRPVRTTPVVLPLIYRPVPPLERKQSDLHQSAGSDVPARVDEPGAKPVQLSVAQPVQVDRSTPPMPDMTPTPVAPPAAAALARTTDGDDEGGGRAGHGDAGSGAAGDGQGAGSGALVQADWAKIPGWEEIYAFHPSRARRAKLSGSATLKCRVRLTRKLEACQLMNETPSGWSFGTAALRLAPRLRVLPRKLGGVEMDDGWVFFTVRFDLPPGSSS